MPWPGLVRGFAVLTGLSQPNLDLGPLGIRSMLYSSAEVSMDMGFWPNCTPLVIGFVIPLNPALVGASFYQQTLGSLSANGSTVYYLSRGGHGVIGT